MSHSSRIPSQQIETVNIRPISQQNGDQGSPNISHPESANILTRNVPEHRTTNPPTIMVQPNGPNQIPGPQIPQGTPQMRQGPGGPGFPQGMPQGPSGPGFSGFGQPQFPPGHPGNLRMGQPQLPPGQPGQPGQPGFSNQHQPMRPTPGPGPQQGGTSNLQRLQTNRFQNDNRGMQNLQSGSQSDSAYANSQICWNQFTACLGTYVPGCCCCTAPYKTVPEGFSGIIMRFGKFHKLVGPGMHYVLEEVDTLTLVDKREKVVELKQQSVVSRDNTSFRVDAVLYYKIVNTYSSRFSVSNVGWALQDFASTTLRNAVGKMTMQEFLQAKEHLAEQIEQTVAQVAESWGAKIIRLLVQDVSLPQEFRNNFSSSAVAVRISEAQVINSKAEVEVARLMRDAADALSTDAAFQIRYIDAIEVLTKSSNPKMIFFPADYTDVGTANNDLLSTMTDEMETLLRKK